MANENKKFVIQQHSSGSDVHWDFMLQIGNILQTYRLDKAPQELVRTPANAVKIFDHPLKFLTYEGSVNKGRGNARIADSGTYEIVHQVDDLIELNINGKILKGNFTLSHIEGDNWQFGKSNI
jgi:bifunctional non-homologous end joining protein LigD